MFKRSPNFPLEKQPKSDGKSIDWFVSDFTLPEVKKLRAKQAFKTATVQQSICNRHF
jgi:hypothetical protein